MKTSEITSHKVTSVSSFLALIEELKAAEVKSGNKADFIFRGQRSGLPLLPKLARLVPKGPKVLETEQRMLDEFKRQMLPFTQVGRDDIWAVLAIAQHHGLPTRLLDWSYSALAALWFCVKDGPKQNCDGKSSSGVVWVFKTDKADFVADTDDEDPFKLSKTRIFRPPFVSQRIMAQGGLFTCHKRLSGDIFIPLERNAAFKSRLVKVTIPPQKFFVIRDQLWASGVTSAVLFPDLDGLAAHLQVRYFHDQYPLGILPQVPSENIYAAL